MVYVGLVDPYGTSVAALNAKICTSLWIYTTGDAVFSSPAVSNGVVYIGSDDHHVYAFGLKKGSEVTTQ